MLLSFHPVLLQPLIVVSTGVCRFRQCCFIYKCLICWFSHLLFCYHRLLIRSCCLYQLCCFASNLPFRFYYAVFTSNLPLLAFTLVLRLPAFALVLPLPAFTLVLPSPASIRTVRDKPPLPHPPRQAQHTAISHLYEDSGLK